MKAPRHLFLSLLFIFFSPTPTAAKEIGICYGQVANNLPSPAEVVHLLKTNGISKIRLFNTEPTILQSLSGTGIDLMIGVPNEILPSLDNPDSAAGWLQTNILSIISADQIKYIAVGNEIFLKDQYYTPYLVPALRNLYEVLQTLHLQDKIKLSSPQAASVLSTSFPPSLGAFDSYLLPEMRQLLQFLQETQAPFMANIYPFFTYANNPRYVSLEYALGGSGPPEQDSGLEYNSLFDAAVDAFVAAMEREGFAGIPVTVTETGWPTAGNDAAGLDKAMAYNGNIIRQTVNGVGTPKRPGVGLEVFLFGLFDENQKGGEEYEQHFGIFSVNGVKAYNISFV
ncbi:glucan endo-1,3-beta-glucosidase-like [Magnolia sinica]|uniref:glucan endo-1,3-beta-glucosidase-like n=1 Tax=Magnolia sinica TaxID=86752 RepID=UPI0026591C09|nr:glucan endo-1,3-beta-glucosidase-like [Magnolia sinica]